MLVTFTRVHHVAGFQTAERLLDCFEITTMGRSCSSFRGDCLAVALCDRRVHSEFFEDLLCPGEFIIEMSQGAAVPDQRRVELELGEGTSEHSAGTLQGVPGHQVRHHVVGGTERGNERVLTAGGQFGGGREVDPR